MNQSVDKLPPHLRVVQIWESSVFLWATLLSLASLIPSYRAQVIDILGHGQIWDIPPSVSLVIAWILHHISVVSQSIFLHKHGAHSSVTLSEKAKKIFSWINITLNWLLESDWVEVHKRHHRETDTAKDPHSPQNGLWNFINFFTVYQQAADRVGTTSKRQKLLRFAPVATLHIPAYVLFWGSGVMLTSVLHVLFKTAMLTQNGFPHMNREDGIKNIEFWYHLPKPLQWVVVPLENIFWNWFLWWEANHKIHHNHPWKSDLSNSRQSDIGASYLRKLDPKNGMIEVHFWESVGTFLIPQSAFWSDAISEEIFWKIFSGELGKYLKYYKLGENFPPKRRFWDQEFFTAQFLQTKLRKWDRGEIPGNLSGNLTTILWYFGAKHFVIHAKGGKKYSVEHY